MEIQPAIFYGGFVSNSFKANQPTNQPTAVVGWLMLLECDKYGDGFIQKYRGSIQPQMRSHRFLMRQNGLQKLSQNSSCSGAKNTNYFGSPKIYSNKIPEKPWWLGRLNLSGQKRIVRGFLAVSFREGMGNTLRSFQYIFHYVSATFIGHSQLEHLKFSSCFCSHSSTMDVYFQPTFTIYYGH